MPPRMGLPSANADFGESQMTGSVADGIPAGEMGAVEQDGGLGVRGGNAGLHEVVVAGAVAHVEGEVVLDGEVLERFGGLGRHECVRSCAGTGYRSESANQRVPGIRARAEIAGFGARSNLLSTESTAGAGSHAGFSTAPHDEAVGAPVEMTGLADAPTFAVRSAAKVGTASPELSERRTRAVKCSL